jgi:hypothetical protein
LMELEISFFFELWKSSNPSLQRRGQNISGTQT